MLETVDKEQNIKLSIKNRVPTKNLNKPWLQKLLLKQYMNDIDIYFI